MMEDTRLFLAQDLKKLFETGVRGSWRAMTAFQQTCGCSHLCPLVSAWQATSIRGACFEKNSSFVTFDFLA